MFLDNCSPLPIGSSIQLFGAYREASASGAAPGAHNGCYSYTIAGVPGGLEPGESDEAPQNAGTSRLNVPNTVGYGWEMGRNFVLCTRFVTAAG